MYLMEERKKGQESFYYPYLSIFPPNYYDFPVMQKDEHSDLLKGTFLESNVTNLRKSYLETYNTFCKHSDEFAKYTYEEYAYARISHMSRVFWMRIATD